MRVTLQESCEYYDKSEPVLYVQVVDDHNTGALTYKFELNVNTTHPLNLPIYVVEKSDTIALGEFNSHLKFLETMFGKIKYSVKKIDKLNLSFLPEGSEVNL